MTDQPLISCLCVSHHAAFLLERSIACFCAQTYPNKELLIVFRENNPGIKAAAGKNMHPGIKYIEVADEDCDTLGDLRNVSVQHAAGEYICVWDDDDWYPDNRLSLQMRGIRESQKDACILLHCIMYDMVGRQAYVSPLMPWEGSLMCRRAILADKLRYASMQRGEDTDLVAKLMWSNCIYPVILPVLYIYVYHGNNISGASHFNMFFARGQKLSKQTSLVIYDILENKMSHEKATGLLFSPLVLDEINYFYSDLKKASLKLKENTL